MRSFALPPTPPAVEDSRALSEPELMYLNHFLHPPPGLARSKMGLRTLHLVQRIPHPRKRSRERRFHLIGRLIKNTLASRGAEPVHDADPLEVTRRDAGAALADPQRDRDLVEAERAVAREQQSKDAPNAQRKPVPRVETADVIGDLKLPIDGRCCSLLVLYIQHILNIANIQAVASGRPAHSRSADPFRNRAVGRNELDPFARPDHLPSAFVYLPMVEVTKRDKVGEVALSALRPELDMMGTGPVDRPVTPGRRAVAMPSLEGPPLRRRDRPRRPAHIDHHRVRLEDPAQGAVAGQPLHGLARDRHSV